MDNNRKKSPFLEKIRHLMRVQHYAIRTEHAYVDWIRRFILYHGKRHPDEMGKREVSEFLTHLAVNRNVAPATQDQALRNSGQIKIDSNIRDICALTPATHM